MSFFEKLQKTFPSFLPHQKRFFFLLTLVAGIAFLLPQSDYQYFISQGDHGRDLYCFKKTAEGAVPYRDYSWVLGPIMPYFYALIFKIFGPTIQSAVLGQNLITLSTGMTTFGICAIFLSPAIACACALSYWTLRGAEFFYTYVHSGGLLTMLLTIYFLFKYLEKPKLFFVISGSLALILLFFIRVNIGACTLFVFFLCCCLADRLKNDPIRAQKRMVYLFLSLFILSFVFLVYAALLQPLPSYVIQQSFPYLKTYRTDIAFNSQQSLDIFRTVSTTNFWGNLSRQLASLLLFITVILSIKFFSCKTFSRNEKINMGLALGSLATLGILNLHEFFTSGVQYRLLWTRPLIAILLFFILDLGTRLFKTNSVRILLAGAMLVSSLFFMLGHNLIMDYLKKPDSLFSYGKNRIYSRQPKEWISVVTATADYIQKNVPENEGIFALPFEPLYYFLTGKDSPTRQLIFFEHNHIPPEQEQQVIADLEKSHVNYILMSNRGPNSREPTMGFFGIDCCPQISWYIKNHFQLIKTIGNPNLIGGWNTDHAILILKRK